MQVVFFWSKSFELYRCRIIRHHHFNVIHPPTLQYCLSYRPPIRGWLSGRLTAVWETEVEQSSNTCVTQKYSLIYLTANLHGWQHAGTLMFNPSNLAPISSTSVCGQATVCTNFICHASALPLRIHASALNTNSIHNLSWSTLGQPH
jgi:hypothetical protein